MFMPYTIICFTMYNTIYAMFQWVYMIYSPLEHGMTYGIFTLRHGLPSGLPWPNHQSPIAFLQSDGQEEEVPWFFGIPSGILT